MAKAYETHPIAEEQIESAFVLARLSEPGLDLEGWRDRCLRSRWHGAGEIAVVSNTRGYVQGLAIIVRPGHFLRHDALEVPCFVVASAADDVGVGQELFRYVADCARQAGCPSIHIHFADDSEQTLSADAAPEEVNFLLRATPKVRLPDSGGAPPTRSASAPR
ncbi:MAG: hypothetical protein J0H11_12630 [Rhizobiales bacterium]|nr:hypothetical protein [Hyphomicrobiales bacterium]